ncbi:hypothetical protein ['Camptotheca acuminata' phytoplasma]|uniref:hypothetical protein n=1 Tax='Camptotheca acuminata' phytoplasma TaxID=3239192 RepID=UPI00351A15E5
MVNIYTESQINKKIKLNNYPCYNSEDNLELNILIKDAPTNLLGVYFDGGVRSHQNNFFTLENFKEMAKENKVNKVYFFYDNTDYCDITLQLKFKKIFILILIKKIGLFPLNGFLGFGLMKNGEIIGIIKKHLLQKVIIYLNTEDKDLN